MRALETAAQAAGRSEASLMEEAGAGLARVLRCWKRAPQHLVIFAGKGHNAGDAFVAARHLMEHGWKVSVRAIFPQEEWRPLARQQWESIRERVTPEPSAEVRMVLLDALFGLGAEGPLREPVRSACQEMNALRHACHGWTVALDGPTGLNFDTGETDPDTVVADLTATIACAKPGLLVDAASDFVGRLAVVPLPDLEPTPAQLNADGRPARLRSQLLTPHALRAELPPRPFSMHKGQAGRVTVIAGSRGLTGAARLSAAAAVKGGAGLVTLAVPEEIYLPLVSAVSPEVMVRPYQQSTEALDWTADVLAIGPGLGSAIDDAFLQRLYVDPRPLVLDADGLNALARSGTPTRVKDVFEGPRPWVLTPHPGEMARILAAWQPQLLGKPRLPQTTAFAELCGMTVLLKGARTIIATPDEPAAFNTTGHPGMASGGMGDVLTGLCAALMAQGHSPSTAARLGAWLLGRAAEIALSHDTVSPESLAADDVLRSLGAAFEALRCADF